MISGWRDSAVAAIDRALAVFLCGVALFSSISIAAASVAGGLAIAAWAAKRALAGDTRWPELGPMRTPLAAFLAACLLAAFLGLDPVRSLVSLRKYLWVILVPVVAESVVGLHAVRRAVGWGLAGLGFAAYHTVANHFMSFLPSFHPPGPMTESGQIVLGMGVAGAFWLDARGTRAKAGWLALIALFGAALVLNTKRGPWIGAFAVLVALGASRKRRAVLAILLAGVVVLSLYGPARKRLVESGRDFLHADNRFHMWTIAADLVPRYPFGVGASNGTIMQSARYGPDAPRHRHFHNNLVTILVESGALGLGAFVWWLTAFGLAAYRATVGSKGVRGFAHAFPLGAFCAFLGWNVAGLFEFNFGDSEIVMLVYLLMGGMLVARRARAGQGEPAAEARGATTA